MVGKRQQPVEERTPDHLVHRVVAADVLPRAHELAGGGEEARCVKPASRGERRLRFAEAIGQEPDERTADRELALDGRRLDGDRLERTLATHAAGRRRVERARDPLGVEAGRLELDRVRRQVVGHPRRERPEPLGERESERELLVVPGRSHRHGDGPSADPQLERLLDRDAVVHLRPVRQAHHAHGSGAVGRWRASRFDVMVRQP